MSEEDLLKKIEAQAEELRQLKSTVYVTHTVCGAVVETGCNNWAEEPDKAVYVMCPVCEDIVDSGELSNGDSHYLVRKPE